jgi:tRNA A37 N6-isopentenylltransferase MiaA
MQSTETGVNGINEPAVYVQLVDDDPEMATALTAEIEALRVRALEDMVITLAGKKPANTQQEYEVANAFLCRARGLARAGKDELAKRMRRAAHRVLGKVVGDE